MLPTLPLHYPTRLLSTPSRSCLSFLTILAWAFWKPGSSKSLNSSKLSSGACKMLEPKGPFGLGKRGQDNLPPPPPPHFLPPAVPLGAKGLAAGLLSRSLCPCLPAGAELLGYCSRTWFCTMNQLQEWPDCNGIRKVIRERTRGERKEGESTLVNIP